MPHYRITVAIAQDRCRRIGSGLLTGHVAQVRRGSDTYTLLAIGLAPRKKTSEQHDDGGPPHPGTLERRQETVNVTESSTDRATDSRILLCPYCGRTQPSGHDRCDACGGWFEPLSLKATHIGMGPWYVRDKAQPFRPGCSFDVLIAQIASGRVKPTTVIRGPTTHQMWSIARHTPGVAHWLGFCHACHVSVKTDAQICPECGQCFPRNHARNELGLLFPTQVAAEDARRDLDHQLDQQQRHSMAEPASGDGHAAQPGEDLVGKVLGAAAAAQKMPTRQRPTAPTHQAGEFADLDLQEPTPTDTAAPTRSIGTLAWCLIVFNAMVLLMLVVLLLVWRHF